MLSKINLRHFQIGSIALLVVLYLIATLRVIFFVHCSSFYDLGIYSEALSRISLNDLNPLIPGRNIHIFNDHFDPILIPFAFLTSIMKAPLLGIFIEYSAILLCWFPLKLLVDRSKISMPTAIFSYAFIILNHAVLDALHTPFHPTTWAMLPLMYFFAFFWLENWKAMLVSLLVLFCCREEFPLIGLPLSLVLFLDHQNREKRVTGIVVLGVTLLWLTFVFYVRSKVFQGEMAVYGTSILQKFFQDPGAVVRSYFTGPLIKMALLRVAPLLVILSFKEVKASWRHIAIILVISSSIFAIRGVSVNWAFHYGTAPVIALLFAFLPALEKSYRARSIRAILGFTIILVIFGCDLVKKIGQGFVEASPVQVARDRCPMHSPRIQAIDFAQTELASEMNRAHSSRTPKILIENNLTGSVLLHAPNAEVYLFGGLQPQEIQYDFVLLEKPLHGDPWPSAYETIDAKIQGWRSSPWVQVIQDNEFVFLASGKILQAQ